jgi:phosphatidylglycerol:prolipoprotein diacylglycerol transferase
MEAGMYPILFRVSGHPIYSYAVLLDAGLVLGLIVAWWQARRRFDASDDPGTVMDATFWSIVGGVAGGRAGYVLAQREYFAYHPEEIWQVWQGGLSWHGAFLGGTVVLLVWHTLRTWLTPHPPDGSARQLPPPLPALTDVLAPGLALGTAFGWVGCFLSGIAHGVVSYGPLTYDLPDLYGVYARRFATQPVGAAWSLFVFALLLLSGRRSRRGFNTFAYLFLAFGGDLLLGFTRADETLYWGLWRVGQVVDAALAAVGLLGLVVLWQQGGNGREEATPLVRDGISVDEGMVDQDDGVRDETSREH